MIGGQRVLGLIPARGGSKGVPRKNVRDLGGKPLLAWTIEAARGSRYLDRFILSSEDTEIIEVARRYGCDVPFVRPMELATDEADTMSVVRHSLQAVRQKHEFIVLLQPTSPLRTAGDIDGAIELCNEATAPSCVSVCEPDKSPYWMMRVNDDRTLVPLMGAEVARRRQENPLIYALNGAVYVGRTERIVRGETFLEVGTVGYVMPKDRSFDIDTELDLKIVQSLVTSDRN